MYIIVKTYGGRIKLESWISIINKSFCVGRIYNYVGMGDTREVQGGVLHLPGFLKKK